MKRAFVLKLTLLFAQYFASAESADSKNKEPIVYGNGQAQCEDELPTLSVASENILSTKAEWDAFVEKYPFYVVGAADSTCK